MKPNTGKYKNIEQTPEVGDKIYIPNKLHVYRGADDIAGGLSAVVAVQEGISAGEPAWFVTVEADPGSAYNWEFLEPRQEELRQRFGEETAHPDPDYRPEFNNANEGWRTAK